MATPPNGLAIAQQSATVFPQAQASQEHTASAPMQGTADEPQNSAGLSEDDQSRLIQLVRRYKDQWSQDRMILMQRCLLNLEFFKGNQYISFGPGSAQFFDAANWINSANQNVQDSDDKDLYQYCNNFYQMLAVGFVAVLSPQVPKSKWLPENAEQLTDVTTAKAAQTLIDIVEWQNKEQSILKQQLLYLFATGAVFRHTRYLVDADRAGSKKEPIFNETDTEIMPDRYHCFNCGTDTATDQVQGLTAPQCPNPNCGNALGQDSFYPAERGPVVTKVGEEEVPNGMVAQDIYCPLEVDVDPAASNLRKTPILNLEVEIHLAAVRSACPDMYDKIQASATSTMSTNGSIDRIARQQVYSETTAYSATLQDQRPTLSRTWIQPWAFDLEDDQEFGKRMRETYQSGILLVNVGDTFLSAREASLTEEWTWAGTHEGFGMYPPAPGDIVVPFQKRYNDMANIYHEFMDRCSAGVTLANADLIDAKSVSGKPLLPGVLNLVKLKRTGAPGSQRLADALFQFQFQMHEEAMEYMRDLLFNAQMFAHVPPQVYGGQGDDNIQTFGGQQQQLNTAKGALNIYWDNIREEHAAADELAVKCAKDNLTDDMRRVIAEKGSEFRNEYVRLDDLQGNFNAYPDTDQGLPVTAAEQRQQWMSLLEAAENNPFIQAIFELPSNQEQAATSFGLPNAVIPGEAMRSKTLQIIEQLLKSPPTPQIDPQTGIQTGLQPSIMPDADIDDFTVLKATVRQYCQENFDIATDNPDGFANVKAYLTAAVAAETAFNIQQEQAKGAAAGAGQQAAAPPPKAPPQPDPAEQGLRANLLLDAGAATRNLLTIGGTPALPQGASLQAQVAANSEILNLAAKIEQITADKQQSQ